jgi:small GTP-binding protein
MLKERGIKLDIPGFLFIDTPGHAAFTNLRKRGGSLADLAILVVSIKEGIKPQTKEHFIALQAKKIGNIIIVQNKIDLVSKEQALENYKEIKEFIKGKYPKVDIITWRRYNYKTGVTNVFYKNFRG